MPDEFLQMGFGPVNPSWQQGSLPSKSLNLKNAKTFGANLAGEDDITESISPLNTNALSKGIKTVGGIEATRSNLDQMTGTTYSTTSSSTLEEINTTESPSLADKFVNSPIGKYSGAIGQAADALAGAVGQRPEMNGPNAELAAGISNGWNAISDAAANFGPWGQLASVAMKVTNLGNNIVGKLGGGTDGMTKSDAILGSPIGFLTGVGLINGFGGQRADTITKDEETFAQVGASYGGTGSAVDDALQKSGKKYGLFSSGARSQANREIAEAKRQQSIMANIADEAKDRFAIQQSMSAINGYRRAFNLQGGYNQASIRAAKNGLSFQTISTAKKIIEKYKDKKKIEEFKEGGSLDRNSIIVEVTMDATPQEFKEGGTLGSGLLYEIELENIIEEFKEGGSFNVIPEGALHARLHHMENAENLTKKGIPVVSEKDGELEQHAEIEKEEIILRLSLTKRLEELAKEDTDEAALEAGKILVEEILNNTVDNTNKLL